MKLTHIYLKTVFLYSVLFIAITLVMLPIISKSNNYLIEANIEATYLTLNSQHQAICELLTTANHINSKIHQDHLMNSNKLDNISYTLENISKIIDIRSKLSNLTFLMPSAILDYQFITQSGIVFTSERIYDSTENYYANDFEYTKVSHSEWLDLFNEKVTVRPVKEAMLDMKTKKSNVLTINFTKFDNSDYHFAILINPDSLLCQLPDTNMQVYTYALNNTNEIVLSKNFDGAPLTLAEEPVQALSYKGTDCIAFQFSDEIFLNKTVYIIPKGYFNHSISSIINLMYLYMTLAIGGCVALACLLAFIHTRNFKKINGFIPASGIPSRFFNNEFETIVHTLNSMNDDNKSLRDECKKIIQSLKNSVFQQLLFNNPVNESEAAAFANSYMPHGLCRLILIDISDATINDRMSVFLSIESKYSKTTAVNYINDNIILLFGDDDYFDTAVFELKRQLHGFWDLQFTINISGVFSDPNRLANAFDEVNAIKFFNINNSCKEIVKFEKNEKLLEFHLNKEKMFEILNSGNKNAYFDFISIFCKNLCGEMLLSKDSISKIYYDFRSVLISLAEKHTLDINLIPDFNFNQNWNDQYDSIIEQSLLICELISSKQADTTPSYSSKILDFCNNNYSDCNLCIAMIAQHFNISENYVSILLKEKTGKNYSDHLESIRIIKSKQLLSNTNQTISQISQAVGYSNENTFYKSFKRVCGITPGQFRKSI